MSVPSPVCGTGSRERETKGATDRLPMTRPARPPASEMMLPALEQAIDAVVLIDQANRILFFNDAAERLWGYGRDEVLGENVSMLVPQAFRAGHDGFIAANRETGINRIVGRNREALLERKDGSTTWVTFSLSKVLVGDDIHYMGFIRDISEEVRQRERVRLLSLAASWTDHVVLILDSAHRIVFTNPAFTWMFGYEEAEALGRRPLDFLQRPDLDDETIAGVRRRIREGNSFQIELPVMNKHGGTFWVTGSVTPVADDSGELRNVIIVLDDMTERQKLQDLQRDMLQALTSDVPLADLADFLCRRVQAIAPEVVCSILLIDEERRLRPLAGPNLPASYNAATDGVPIGPNAGSCGTAAWRGEPVQATDIATDPLWPGDVAAMLLAEGLLACWSSPIRMRDGRVAGTFAFYYREKRGASSWHERIVEACLDLCMLAIERHEARQRIALLSHYDPLTGLPNRAGLSQEAGALLAKAGEIPVAALLLDIDNFKDVNETLGHAAGDRLLIEISNRLRQVSSATDLVGRIDGDSFALVIPGCDAPRASALAERLLRAFGEPADLLGISMSVSASIGISIRPGSDTDAETLMRQAESAMSRVKQSGRGAYRFFSHGMNRLAQDRLVLGVALREAIALGRLHLEYQPQLRPVSRVLHGVEALIRWDDPVFGRVAPARFIPIAEATGQIEALGQWVLQEACRQAAAWRAAGITIPAVSVNLSPSHLGKPGLPDGIAALLRSHGLPPNALTIEVTESVMMDDHPEALDNMQALRALGVGLSMDDFGTGYSSLSSLSRMPVTELKIDRSFVRNLTLDPNARAITTAVIRIGQSLGLTVVAEGVETDEQLQVLTELHCDVVQGYLLGRPTPAQALEAHPAVRPGAMRPLGIPQPAQG